jgi:parallel beta-helix repeat protein
MKTSLLALSCSAAAGLLLTNHNLLAALGGGGPLTPPGPPAVMMKTLEEIEPRRLIVSLPQTITEPGSYYIATNLTGVAGQNGITIDADSVTLDLGGWSLIGVGGSLDGIFSTNHHHIVVRHGNVGGWGDDGIDFTQAGACRIEDMSIHGNAGGGLIVNTDSQVIRCIVQANGKEGIATSNGVEVYDCVSGINGGHGIACGTSSLVRGCYANGNAGAGIVGGLVESLTVLDCAVNDNKGGGIVAPRRSLVRNCQAWRNQASGIFADEGSTVIGCTSGTNSLHGIETGRGSTLENSSASLNAGSGFSLGDYSRISGCTALSNAVDGIRVNNKCLVRDNTVSGHITGAGIHALQHRNRLESNSADDNRRGLHVEGRLNVVVKNSAAENGLDYDIAPGNQDALVISPGSAFVNNEPWANFRH